MLHGILRLINNFLTDLACAPPIPHDTTEFLHRRADTTRSVTCEDGFR